MIKAIRRCTVLAFLYTALLAAGPALAADVNIAAFFGHWKGNALSESEISIHFQLTQRDIDVRVGPAGNDGFRITWATVQRQKGDPNQPEEVLKETTVDFQPSARPGAWVGKAGDPLATGEISWARIAERTLIIYNMGIRDDGAYDMQIYKRTLTGSGMELEFTRTIDGGVARTAKGRLIKFSN